MLKMRYGLIVLSMLLCSVTSAAVQVGIGIGHPNVSIGINLPVYPELGPVRGYPVYYAPRLESNYFFYDGMYWVYEGDNWYASSWYNGPWAVVAPEVVPLFVLRIPVRYYRRPPAYFAGWRVDAPPLWGVYWGPAWEQRRRGWDRWDRRVVYTRAPLPVYQRRYVGDRYPRVVEQQITIRTQNYRYQPRDTVVRVHFKEQQARVPASAQQKTQRASQQKSTAQQKSASSQVKKEQGAPSAKPFAPGQVKKEQGAQPAKAFAPGQQQKEQRTRGTSSKSKDEGKGKGRGKDEERGRERNK